VGRGTGIESGEVRCIIVRRASELVVETEMFRLVFVRSRTQILLDGKARCLYSVRGTARGEGNGRCMA
jgi:hypothetical protein